MRIDFKRPFRTLSKKLAETRSAYCFSLARSLHLLALEISFRYHFEKSYIIFFTVFLHAAITWFLVTRFMEEMSYVFLFTFFSLPLFFTLVSASISHFVTAATKFSCCSSKKKCLLCFLSFALTLCRSFSRWVSLACRLLSLFSLSLYYKFVDMTINLSWIL